MNEYSVHSHDPAPTYLMCGFIAHPRHKITRRSAHAELVAQVAHGHPLVAGYSRGSLSCLFAHGVQTFSSSALMLRQSPAAAAHAPAAPV